MLYKQKSLFSEKVANQEVINSLERQISKLKGVPVMSKVIKSSDGKYYRVHDYEELTEDQVIHELAALQVEVAELEAIAPTDGAADQNNEVPAQPEQPAAPADNPPAQPEQPAADPAPAAPEQPAEQPAEQAPADPAAPDPNAVTLT